MVIQLADIEQLAKLQATKREAAAFLGLSLSRFNRLLESDEDVAKAWAFGQAHGCISLRRQQFRLADTSAAMAIHLGKQYLAQRDTTAHELSGPNGSPIQTEGSIDVSKLTPEQRQVLREILTKSQPAD